MEGKKDKKPSRRFKDEILRWPDATYITLSVREIKDMIMIERDLAVKKTVRRLYSNAH